MNDEERREGLEDVEAALASLRPVGSLDRDRLMFRAGQLSARRRSLAWPAATLAMAMVAVALSAVLLGRPGATPSERIVYVPVRETRYVREPAVAGTVKVPAAPWPDAARYLELRRRVLSEGMDALPAWEPADSAGEPLLAGAYRLWALGRSGGPSAWLKEALGERNENDEI